MIVAENSDLVFKSTIANTHGSLAHNIGSIYNEFQIINQLGEEICALDYQNRVARIKPQAGYTVRNLDDRCLIIQYRYVVGPRTIGQMGIENSQATHGRITIPYDVLMTETVFVEEVNALFFNPLWHPGVHDHPHSVEYISREHDKIRSEVGRGTVFDPISIMANDPSGKIKQLFIELNGKICTVKVTNYNAADETDVVAVGVRGAVTGSIDEFKIVKTSFTELRRQDPLCWEIQGFLISTDRTWFEHKLAVEKKKPIINGIPSGEIEALLEKARETDVATISSQAAMLLQRDHDVRDWQTRYKQLKDSYEDIVKGGYLERSSALATRKLDVDEAKVASVAHETNVSYQTEQHKLRREQLSTLTNVAKTVVVLAPLAVLLWNYMHKESPA